MSTQTMLIEIKVTVEFVLQVYKALLSATSLFCMFPA